jgi:hypothetical protein
MKAFVEIRRHEFSSTVRPFVASRQWLFYANKNARHHEDVGRLID